MTYACIFLIGVFVPQFSVEHELNSLTDVTHNVYVRVNACSFASPGDLFGQLMREDPSTIKGAEILMLGEMLTLPQNFG